MSTFVWPLCAKCSNRVDVEKRGDRYIARCCGGEAEVHLGYVLATPTSIELQPKSPRTAKGGRPGRRRAA